MDGIGKKGVLRGSEICFASGDVIVYMLNA